MSASDSGIEQRELQDTWSVVVVYEDAATRARAMAVCDRLMRELWSEVEFQFQWWRTDFLTDPLMAHHASEAAAAAHFVIFCPGEATEWPVTVMNWVEDWAAQRGDQEGALVDLTDAGAAASHVARRKARFLGEMARRARMDYLALAAWSVTGTLPDSLDKLDVRATRITSILDDILRHQPQPRFHVTE